MLTFSLLISTVFLSPVFGHGMLWDPPNRSSLWRHGFDSPVNYNDNQNFCGGFQIQHEVNKGKCGICGDDYRQPLPRDNELGGLYGKGIISKTYYNGTNIPIIVRITANHKGYFKFDLCNLDKTLTETNDCFISLKTIENSEKYYIGSETGDYTIYLSLPKNLVCKHCILRWTYITGNSWGICEDGSGAIGCGPQENFRSCSDIKIVFY